MKVLIACERFGVIRDEFIKRGHDAWSCDLVESAVEGPHITGDVTEVLDQGWDLMIAHPDCTYLTNSAAWAFGDGPYHQKVKEGTLVGEERREARVRALDFVRLLMGAPIPRIAVENPIGAISTAIRKPDQIIHPYQYGDDASKATCLWLTGLPALVPTRRVQGRIVNINGKEVERWANQTDSGQNRLSPSEDRAMARAKTYKGWAEAMAEQWG
ncbi:MAG: hypothetical protein ACRC6V_12180 [Bacteroidales bacterium]